jgi:hypothetical protein
MCHGGASPSRNQFTTWTGHDFHSRAYATLTTAYAINMVKALGGSSPTTDARCITCHAPNATIPEGYAAKTVTLTEGVSCETCHGGAGAWLRGHTRPDWTYSDRVHAGMRDLRDAFVRANTCVACHQAIDPNLVKAGHPQLTFELDGQTASEPRHWKEKASWFGAKAWLVGQAVALREASEDLRNNPDSGAGPDQAALLWILQQVPGTNGQDVKADALANAAAWGNQLAQSISNQNWDVVASNQILTALAATSDSFLDSRVAVNVREMRAERLVLGLDRVFKSLHPEATAPGATELTALFEAVREPDHFDPASFSSSLRKFADAATTGK